jgi:hypothetical protein
MSTFGKSKGGGRRSAPRTTAPLIALVTTLKDTFSAVLVDLSSTGARLRGRSLPGVDREMFITIDGVIGFGTIVWSKGDERGVEFDPALSASDVARLRQKIAQAAGLPPEIKAAFEDWTAGVAR